VTFSVPTGAFGNSTAAIIAKKMGLPIKTIISATNQNDVLHRFFTTGIFEGGVSVPTCSPAMDIQVPYNFERFLYLLCDNNTEMVKSWMTEFEETGKIKLDQKWLDLSKDLVKTYSISDDETLQMMANIYKSYSYILDPHTSVGVTSALQHANINHISSSNNDKIICLATKRVTKQRQVCRYSTRSTSAYFVQCMSVLKQ